MEYSLPGSLGALLAVIAVGLAGLLAGDVMPVRVVLMMVAPSMVVFGLLAFGLGVRHGEHRAS
jgi:hypothetical protein